MGCGPCWSFVKLQDVKVSETVLPTTSIGFFEACTQHHQARAITLPAYVHPSLHRLEPTHVAEVEFRLSKTLAETEEATELTLSSLDLYSVPSVVFARSSLVRLTLSRNCLLQLPPEIASLTALKQLDLSRNRLKVLPEAIGKLRDLQELNVMTNHLRPLERSIPLEALSCLKSLERLDVRFNPKLLKSLSLADVLTAHVPPGCDILLGAEESRSQVTCGERDATLLRSQLEPWSTPALRRRLLAEFAIETDLEEEGREIVMQMLLRAYNASGQRAVRRVSGIPPQPCSEHLLTKLLKELRCTDFPAGMGRERQGVQAEGYIILNRAGSKKQHSAAAKLLKHIRVWDLAYALMQSVDFDFAQRYTAIAVTKQFVGSPHVDTENVGPFYGLSLGDFQGGCICVESSPFEVVEMDTHNKFGRIDGRFPHWVSPHTGERYSIIYYQTSGLVVPKTTAVFV